jgi:tRNA dimethylallyltransferase
VRALRQGLFEGPARNEELRERLEKTNTVQLFEELERTDPATAKRIDRHNPRRLVRALEVFHKTGKPISELQKEWHRDEDSRATVPPGFILNRDRKDLHMRIELRIDQQIASGWVTEVRQLLERGLEKNATAMQAAGYRELVAHVRGNLSLAEAVALIKIRTRQLAKRQLTWFRREPQLDWLEIGREELASFTAQRILQMIKQKEENSVS